MSLDDRERFPYFTRMVPSDTWVAVGMAEVIRHFSWTRAALITQDSTAFRLVCLYYYTVHCPLICTPAYTHDTPASYDYMQ